MKAGKLNRRIDILAQSEATRSQSGALVPGDWNVIASTWASIDIQRSSLLYEPSQFVSQAVYRVTMRYRNGLVLTSANRIRYTDNTTGLTHTYTVESVVNPEADKRTLLILAFELNEGD